MNTIVDSIDEKTFRYIQDNVPDSEKKDIEDAFYKYNGDLLEIISYLMKIPPLLEKPKTEWEERREICDSLDTEMQKKLKPK
jgi:hypothetical protein